MGAEATVQQCSAWRRGQCGVIRAGERGISGRGADGAPRASAPEKMAAVAASKWQQTSAQFHSTANSSELCMAAGSIELGNISSLGAGRAAMFSFFFYFSCGYNLLSIFS